jgi:hypothetical protein
MLGGLARRAQYLKEQKDKLGERRLLVDAGNVFGNNSVQDKFKAETALLAMNMLGYDALNVGDRELLYGLEYLREQTRNLHYPLLSANLNDSARDELLFKPYVIKELPGVRVALLGLSSGLMQSAPQARVITVAKTAETVKKYVAEIGSRADLIVLLADITYQGAQELTRQVKGIDIILVSRDGQYIFSPAKTNEVIIAQAGNQGRYLGQLKIFLNADKKIAKFEGNLIILDDKVSEDVAMRQFLNRRQDEAAKLLGPAAAPVTPPRPSPPTAGAAASPGPEAANPGAAAEPLTYVTHHACFRCHQEMIIRWEKTMHATAFKALKVKSQWADPNCVRCHTTGYGSPSGFISREKTPQFLHVQCEACHGPAGRHVKKPQKGYGQVTEATCKGCHNQEQDPGFNYREALKRGVH